MSKVDEESGFGYYYGSLEKQYFEYFGVSNALSPAVFAAETRVQNVFKEAKQNGTLPFNCTKVHFIGEPRVGKTSTMKRLLGKHINNLEKPTDGIDRKSVEVKCGQHFWIENKNSGWADYNESLAFCAAQSIKETAKKSTNITRQLTDCGFISCIKYVVIQISELIKNTKHMLAICFLWLFVRALFIPLKNKENLWGLWGFPIIFLLFMSWFGINSLWNFNKNLENPMTVCKSYRAFTTLSFFTFLELSVQNTHVWLAKNVILILGERFLFMENIVHSMSVATFVFCIFFIQSSGCRTGFVLVLCYALGPNPKNNDLSYKWISVLNVKEDIYYNILESLLTSVCVFIAFSFCLQLKRLKDRVGNMLTYLLSAFVIAVLSVASRYLSLFFIIFCGLETGVGFFNGLYMGRAFERKAGFPYLVRKGIGLAEGVLFVKFVIGWEFYRPGISNYYWTIRHLVLILVVTGEIVRYFYVKKSGIPGRETRYALRNVEMGNKPPSRLVLMDYAGDAVWHPTHHIFMSNYSVYLLVFSLLELQNNIKTRRQEDYFNRSFLLWLHGVSSHTEKQRDFKILIVGTHRSNMSDKEVNKINEWLGNKLENCSYRKNIYTKQDGLLVFAIENLENFENDEDLIELRKSIQFITQENMTFSTDQYPIKWRKLSKVIEQYRKKEKFIISLAQFRKEAEAIDVVSSENTDESKLEFIDILDFFEKSGHILYEKDAIRENKRIEDEIYIVTDPNYLIKIFKMLEKNDVKPKTTSSKFINPVKALVKFMNPVNKENVSGPRPLSDRNVLNCFVYESFFSKLLGANSKLIINLLKRYDLLCATGKKNKPGLEDSRENTYIIPSRLSSLSLEQAKEELESYQFVFHFVFSPYGLAPVLFRRLLVHCVNILDFNTPVSLDHHIRIYQNFGFFKSFNQMQLKYSINELCVKYEQENSIEVCLENPSWNEAFLLIRDINSHLQTICGKNFTKVNYYVEFIVKEGGNSENISYKRIYRKDEAEQNFPSKDKFLKKCGVENRMAHDDTDSPEIISPLQANWTQLIKEMDIDNLTSYLYQDKVISLEEFTNFHDAKMSGQPRSDRAKKFLIKIEEKGEQGLSSLNKALIAIDQKHLADKLKLKPI